MLPSLTPRRVGPSDAEPLRYAISRFFGSLDPIPATFLLSWFIGLLLVTPIFVGFVVDGAFGSLILTALASMLSLAAVAALIRDVIRWHISRSSLILLPGVLLLLAVAWVFM